MSIIEKAKAHPRTLLATVAIASLTAGFAGGMGVGKLSTATAQSALANQALQQGIVPPAGAEQGMMPPDRAGRGMTPPDQAGGKMTQPDVTSGATESSTTTNPNSSDAVNALKEKNQEIKAQIESSNQ
ncbi:TPA: hypothetical protein TY768_000531 [Streptococcus suis]|nr:hypothetical protein [Streptococcus suis]